MSATREHLAALKPALVGGPYRAPDCKAGDQVEDLSLGPVEVAGFTDGPLPWPCRRQRGAATPLLTDELARAVRTESAYAVAYWWDVSRSKVGQWRAALGVKRVTAGTRELLRANGRKGAKRRDAVRANADA